jgi:hypothetical protein
MCPLMRRSLVVQEDPREHVAERLGLETADDIIREAERENQALWAASGQRSATVPADSTKRVGATPPTGRRRRMASSHAFSIWTRCCSCTLAVPLQRTLQHFGKACQLRGVTAVELAEERTLKVLHELFIDPVTAFKGESFHSLNDLIKPGGLVQWRDSDVEKPSRQELQLCDSARPPCTQAFTSYRRNLLRAADDNAKEQITAAFTADFSRRVALVEKHPRAST